MAKAMRSHICLVNKRVEGESFAVTFSQTALSNIEYIIKESELRCEASISVPADTTQYMRASVSFATCCPLGYSPLCAEAIDN